jgi:thiamine pyrophosphokinase
MVNVAMTDSKKLGILFTGGEGPAPQSLLRIIPAGDPLLVAADSGLLLAERAGLSPHWIIGDMDSLPAERLASYPPEMIQSFPHDKDFTDTELAFLLLREKGCTSVWIIGGGGGRTDHLFGIRSLFEREVPPERWITAREDIRCIEAPSASSILPSAISCSSNNAPLAPVSVFPLGDGPWEAESSGLHWPLAGVPWNRGFFGLSNRADNGVFTVTAKQGRFLVMLPLAQ